MDNTLLAVINHILFTYGDDVFDNMPRTNAMLLDLAPGMTRERILVRNFIEINGYRQLKNAGHEYPILRQRLIQSLTDTFCLERTAAEWVTQLFAEALGYDAACTVGLPAAGLTDVPVHWQVKIPVALGKAHTVAVASDGTVFAGGANEHFQCDVSNWRDIVAVAAGDEHTLGLRANGTVVAAGRNTYDQCDVTHLTNIASVYAFGNDSICVRHDGTAVLTGRSRLDLSHFENIQTITRHPEGFFGIRRDGTVAVACENAADTKSSDWLQKNDNGSQSGDNTPDSEEGIWAMSLENAVQIISTYVNGSIVLKNDGRLYKMNKPDNYFAPWPDVVSIVDLSDYFALLRADGTVRILSYDRDRPRKATDADHWQDIVAIFGKYKRLIGLTKNGRLRVVCTDPDWQKRNGSLDYMANWHPVGLPAAP